MWPFSREKEIEGPIVDAYHVGFSCELDSFEEIRIWYPGRPIDVALSSNRGMQAYFLEVGEPQHLNLPMDILKQGSNADFLIIKRPRSIDTGHDNQALFATKGLRFNQPVIIGSDPKYRYHFSDMIPGVVAPKAVLIELDRGGRNIIGFRNLEKRHITVGIGVSLPTA